MLSTLFPLLGYLDDQCGEFLESWMAYIEFDKFPSLTEYYTSIGNGALLKEKYNTIKNFTLLRTSKILCTIPTTFLGGHSQPNPTHIEYTTVMVENFLHY